MSIQSALIVANGVLPSRDSLGPALREADYVLAADGGANALLALGITPNAILGDMDSVSATVPASIPRISAPDQDFTDLDKAVGYLLEQGARRITLVGVTGGRLDHTFGTLSVLAKYGRRVPLTVLDDIGIALLVDVQLDVSTVPGQTVSLLPLGPVTGIVTEGLQWNLRNETLAPGVRDGTSNRATAERVSITIGAGDLIAYIHHPSC